MNAKNTTPRIKIGYLLSESLRYERRGRQRFPKSSLLFNIYHNSILYETSPIYSKFIENDLCSQMILGS